MSEAWCFDSFHDTQLLWSRHSDCKSWALRSVRRAFYVSFIRVENL